MRTIVSSCAVLALLGLSAVARAQDPRPPAQPQPTREQRIAELVRKLGDSSFEVREAAQRDLEQMGAPALTALDEAAHNPDPEVASRAVEAASRIRAGAPREAPGTRPRARDAEPDEPPIPSPGIDPTPGMPDMDEVMRDLEQQLPDGMGKLFRDMLRRGLPQPDPGNGQQPGVRVWTWRQGGEAPQDLQLTPTTTIGPLGVAVAPATPALRAQLGIAEDEGLVVDRLLPGGFAAAHGIERYDVIVGVDGHSVRTARDLEPLLRQATTVELYRRAQAQKVMLPPVVAPTPPKPTTPAPPGGPHEQRSF